MDPARLTAGRSPCRLQCAEGHTLCGACTGKVTTCPSCRCDMDKDSPIRNIIAERIAAKIKVGCFRSKRGGHLPALLLHPLALALSAGGTFAPWWVVP